MSEQIDELEDGKADVEKKLMRANSEVTQMKTKFEQEVSGRLEELEDAKWVLWDWEENYNSYRGCYLCENIYISLVPSSFLLRKRNRWCNYLKLNKGWSRIGRLWVRLSLRFKARLSATSLLWKSVFIRIEIGTNYHNKNFAFRLALKETKENSEMAYSCERQSSVQTSHSRARLEGCVTAFHLCIFLNPFRSCNRRKLTQKLAESEEGLASSLQKASNAEKARNRLNSELEDALIDLEKVTRVSQVLSTQTT